MRSFLPIKGPGGRYLTPNEKIALLVLGLTMVLCVLTLTAGDRAYTDGPSRNPVFGVVAWLSRSLGGGIVALYGLILVWSALIFFKGERVARIGSLPGRVFAAVGVTVGVSGVLGLGHLQSAGGLGQAVGGALGNTLGDAVGFPLLLMLMLLGFHLAGQGAWNALRVPAVAVAGAAGLKAGAYGFETSGRFGTEQPMPDDGDPTADERSLAVTKAMEEIERSQGVTIVDVEPEVEPETESRASIGEEVEAAGAPAPDTEEDEVRRGLDDVHRALGARAVEDELEDSDEEDLGTAEEAAAGEEAEDVDVASRPEDDELADPPVAREDDASHAASAYGAGGEDAPEIAETDGDEDGALIYEEVSEGDDETAGDDREPVAARDEDWDGEEDDDSREETVFEGEEDGDEPSSHGLVPVPPAVPPAEETWPAAPEGPVPPRMPPRYLWDEEEEGAGRHAEESAPASEAVEAASGPTEETDGGETEPQADGFGGDPYARGGLVRRLQGRGSTPDEDERPYTSFDWRGHPLD